jgi:hypothetical protein
MPLENGTAGSLRAMFEEQKLKAVSHAQKSKKLRKDTRRLLRESERVIRQAKRLVESLRSLGAGK